jgi:hypothetical protein
MEALSTKDLCLQGLSLAEALIDTLHSIPDAHNPTSSALTPYQPLIFTIFGLATGNLNPLVRSYGYLVLCRLCSVDFYGLGVAEHPRIDRLLSTAFSEISPDWPDRLIELSEAILTTAWSFILLHERFNSKFPLSDPDGFTDRLKAVVEKTKPNVHGDYSFAGSVLVFGYHLGIRCALALQHLNDASPQCTAIALMENEPDSIQLLLNIDLAHLPPSELEAYLASCSDLSRDYLKIIKTLPSKDYLILSKIDITAGNYSDDLLFALFEYLASDHRKLDVVLALFSGTLKSSRPSRTLLQCLKCVLEHIVEEIDFETIAGLFLNPMTACESNIALQLLAYSLTFHPGGVELSPSLIKSSVMHFVASLNNPALIDCAILIVCKARSLILRRAVAIKVLPLLSLSESRKKLLIPVLQDIL